jgi:hypothetical protein
MRRRIAAPASLREAAADKALLKHFARILSGGHIRFRANVGSAHAGSRRFGRYAKNVLQHARVNPRYPNYVLAIAVFCVTSCATTSRHEFSEPTAGWQTKTGQLMYRSPKIMMIGDAVVRFSKTGDFELTVSKGPGITLLSLRRDATFAKITGAFARQGWSGPVTQAPAQLRGWLGLRDQFLRAPNQKTLRYTAGDETFLFRSD